MSISHWPKLLFAPVSLQPPGQLPVPPWFALKSVDAYSPPPINRTDEPSPGGNEINGECLGHISAFGSRKLAKWRFHIVCQSFYPMVFTCQSESPIFPPITQYIIRRTRKGGSKG